MSTSVAQHPLAVLAPARRPQVLACAPTLRAAAATLAGSIAPAITATRVIGVLGQDDVTALHALATELAAHHGLDAAVLIQIQTGSFAVHFRRRAPAPPAIAGQSRLA